MRSCFLSFLCFFLASPGTPTTLAGAPATPSSAWFHSQGWQCWHSSSDSVPYLPKNSGCWIVKHWSFTIPHLPACCQYGSEEGVGHFSSLWRFVLSLEHMLHFQRKDLQTVVAPSSILCPSSCTSCLLSLGKLTFFGFCLFADLRYLLNKHFHKKCSQHMHTFGNKGSPSNFGKKHLKCDYTSLHLQPLEYECSFFLPVFFSASSERNENLFMFTMCLIWFNSASVF